jgi:Holliday junction DNA helicase RuvA
VSLSEGRAEVKAGLIYYEVMVPGYLEAELNSQMDQSVEFFTIDYLEGASGSQQVPRLIGFASDQERRFFEFLLKVPGMGMRTSLKALSITPAKFAQMIESGRPEMLAELPGIGKKSAERIVGELRGKLEGFVSPEALRPLALGEDEITAVSVLEGLGLRRMEAEELVKRVKSRGITSRDELVQSALKERGRKAAEVRR